MTTDPNSKSMWSIIIDIIIGIILATALLAIISCQPEPPDAPVKRPERPPTTVEVPGDFINRC